MLSAQSYFISFSIVIVMKSSKDLDIGNNVCLDKSTILTYKDFKHY